MFVFLQRGFKVYFLSNVNSIDLKYDKEAFEIFKFIDGAVYSAEVRCAKPEKECYEALLNKYNLVPEECIFIDDNLANIEMAKKLKINSVLFDNLERVKNEVENIININNKELANI